MKLGSLLKVFLPFLALNHDKSTSPDFPPLPGVLKLVSMKVFYSTNAGCWQFATFDRKNRAQTYVGVKVRGFVPGCHLTDP
jgi:hypothetical protein